MKRFVTLLAVLLVGYATVFLLGAAPARGAYQLADTVIQPQTPETAAIVAAYTPLVGRIPRAHLNLIQRVYRTPEGLAWAQASTSSLGLPLPAWDIALPHEVGHLVGYANDFALQRAFEAVFWPGGRQRMGILTTYATLPHEDFAETYRMVVEGYGHHTERGRWMLENVPELPR